MRDYASERHFRNVYNRYVAKANAQINAVRFKRDKLESKKWVGIEFLL